jgi:spermidine synthase
MSSIDIREEAGVRTLHFGSEWIQGAMRIARPWQLELDYTKEMMASLLMREGARFPRHALLIGLGAASLTKFLYRYCPQTKITVVEIDPQVVAAAQHFFKLPDDPKRLNIVVEDGVAFMSRTDKSYDLILVDGYDADALAGALDTLPFYQMCRAHLTDAGIMAANIFGRRNSFKASYSRINGAFEGRSIAFPSCDSGNVIAFATAGDAVQITLEDLREQALKLKERSGLNLLPTLSRLENAQRCKGGIMKF